MIDLLHDQRVGHLHLCDFGLAREVPIKNGVHKALRGSAGTESYIGAKTYECLMSLSRGWLCCSNNVNYISPQSAKFYFMFGRIFFDVQQ